MYVSSWITLASINGLKRTNNKGSGKLRWSHRIEGILGMIDTTATNLGEIFLGNPDLLLFMWLALCFDSLYIKSWKKLRVSHTLNGQTS